MIKLRVIKDVDTLSKELDRFLDNMVYGDRARLAQGGRTWSPQVDVYERMDGYQVVAELPGMLPGDLELMVDRTHLKITGKRFSCADCENYRVHQSEISYGPFGRIFRMPGPVLPEQVSASFENGLLIIQLPKEQARNGRIEVQ